ncbi:hypothetical protein [Marinoscillum sp. 108]|uniref:hypothetical protein n=1 Tax=Marinoscillum sp. 108 TaxID=2653151 RepID=UPI0012F306D4|nr:hypothetical protein [Marinoscillum sp. 108]VXD12032.1 conserved exported hypothetical protein [Marinoscillum sp. 108]
MNKKVNVVLLVALSFVFTYCSNAKKEAASEKAAEKKQELEQFVEEQFEYPLPTSFEVTKMLQDANASYNSEITNDAGSVDKYVAEWQKALNLGVYGADLSYASTFDKQQESVAFLNASRRLIEELNVSTAFNKSLADRIEDNLENKDSLIMIITESFYQTYNYLNKSGDEKTSLLVVAGSVIEGLYITAQLIEASDYNASLMNVLAAQKDQVGDLTTLMEAHASDENVNKVLPFLRYVNLFYDQIGEGEEISKGQFDDVSASISEMRAKIVG